MHRIGVLKGKWKLLIDNVDWKIAWTPRDGNCISHNLARWSLDYVVSGEIQILYFAISNDIVAWKKKIWLNLMILYFAMTLLC